MKIINGYEKITLHLAPQDQGYDKAMAAFECSLDNLGLPGLGLYLIHWPGTSGLKKEDPQNAHLREGSWKALEELHRNGEKCQVTYPHSEK